MRWKVACTIKSTPGRNKAGPVDPPSSAGSAWDERFTQPRRPLSRDPATIIVIFGEWFHWQKQAYLEGVDNDMRSVGEKLLLGALLIVTFT